MIVRLLYLALIAYLARLVWRSLFQPTTGGKRTTIYKGLMVRDPVCGRHVLEDRALRSVESGETIHFCSETCRARYVESLQAQPR
jgi:YHS domain-containing protein